MDVETRKKLVARLRRAEGQVAAVRRMLEDHGPSVDALLQVSAARGALGKTGLLLLDAHVEDAMRAAARCGDEAQREEILRDVMDVFGRYRGLNGS